MKDRVIHKLHQAKQKIKTFIQGLLCNYGWIDHTFSDMKEDGFFKIKFKTCNHCSSIYQVDENGKISGEL